jgi:ABC-2 type transport system ATP-binding protein
MTTSPWAIDLTHVDKMYRGKVHALRGIDMRVLRGEIFGLLGPNGAGKSTLVKILMTVISPTRAEGTVLGMPVGHKPTLARIGYLPEHHKFPDYLTGGQVLDFYAALSGVPRARRRQRAPELLELVGMSAWANTRVRQYSKGMRQRIGIAQALMHDPDLVVLDEPTDGVDPVGRRDIRGMVQRLKDLGKTVFLNSHLLSELEMVCDRVAILVQGMVASQGTIAELTDDQARYEIELIPDPDATLAHTLARAIPEAASAATDEPPAATDDSIPRPIAWTGSLRTGDPFRLTRTGLSIKTTDPARVQPVLDRLRAANVTIRSMRPVRPSLEDLFMRAVTDPTTGKAAAPGAIREARP